MLKICVVFCVVWICAAGHLSAQSDKVDGQLYVIHLEYGSMVEGTVLEWKYGEFIKIKTPDGLELEFPHTAVKKVVKKDLVKTEAIHPYTFEEEGMYYTFKTQLITANNGDRANGVYGFGISVSGGKKFNRHLSLGGGVGHDVMIWNTGEKFIPLFGEVTGYLSPKNASLFYNVAAGYSFALKDEDYGITAASGGLMVYPSFGLRFGRKAEKLMLDVGYKFQKAEFTYASQWDARNTGEQRLLYKRLVLRFGVLF